MISYYILSVMFSYTVKTRQDRYRMLLTPFRNRARAIYIYTRFKINTETRSMGRRGRETIVRPKLNLTTTRWVRGTVDELNRGCGAGIRCEYVFYWILKMLHIIIISLAHVIIILLYDLFCVITAMFL